MKERIKAVRKALGMNQTEFGKALGASLSAAYKWEAGESGMSDATIMLVCQKFGISEKWLRTGEGQMLLPKAREEEIAEFVGQTLRDETPEFRRRLISVLARLDDNGWSVLERIADGLTKKD